MVEELTEPGPLRDRLFSRWLRNEMVERLRGDRLLRLPEDYAEELYREIRGVITERFGPGVFARVAPCSGWWPDWSPPTTTRTSAPSPAGRPGSDPPAPWTPWPGRTASWPSGSPPSTRSTASR
ncbi:hypothetical protein ACR6C2_15790 [Streptomyces sp. INA 01156]